VKKRLVLVAEDEDDVRELIVSVFEFSGFDVIGVPDGAAAVKAATESLPDIILLDVRMPNMTGFEACQAIKADENTQHIPVIFLSAYGQEAEVATGLELGAEEYLTKPFDLSELVKRVNDILEKYGKG
jgi:DNA-binding response OmpR family regulator